MNIFSMALTGILALGGDDADAQLSMVIGALLGLAGLIFVATLVYWRMTRPQPRRSSETSRRGDSAGQTD